MKASFLAALVLCSMFCFPLRADSDLVGNSEYTSRSTMRLAPVAKIRWQDIERLNSGRIQSSKPSVVPNPEPKISDEKTPPPLEAIRTYERTDFYDGCGFMASTSFRGAPFDSSIVPDVMGAVSGEFVFTTLNGSVQIQRRDGSVLGLVSDEAFWAPTETGNFHFDPRACFDPISGRFIYITLATHKLVMSSVCLAVSASADPSGLWYYYVMDADQADTVWADFPDVGHNDRWIAITANMWNFFYYYRYSSLWVLDKSSALAGDSLVVTRFNGAGYNGIGKSTRVSKTLDSQPDSLYLVLELFLASSGYGHAISVITGTAVSPSLSVMPGSAYSIPGYFPSPYRYEFDPFPAKQSGTTVKIEAVSYGNAVCRQGYVYVAYSKGIPEAATSSDTLNSDAILWYKILPSQMPNPIIEFGLITNGPNTYFFVPSLAVNSRGDLLIGCTYSDSTVYPQSVFLGRLGNAPAGSIEIFRVFKESDAPWILGNGEGRQRWGDYTATVVDPLNDIDFWTIGEWVTTGVCNPPGDSCWSTWWANILTASDIDSDRVSDLCDNCPNIYNPGQEDADTNGIGDACGFLCGDANDDAYNDISDAVYLIAYIFSGGPAPEPLQAGDANCDGAVDISDAVYLVNFIFSSGPEPCEWCE